MRSKQDLFKIQRWVLKVNIHCHGCEQKVKKLLHKIDGVYSVKIEADEGKVVVEGNVDPAKLVKKLKRGGKHAEIWGGQKGVMYSQNYPFNPQFQNMQVHNGPGQIGELPDFPNVKGAQDDEYDHNFEEGYGQAQTMHHKKMVPMMGDGPGSANNNSHKDSAIGSGKKINGSVKKGDVMDQAMLMKGKGGNYNEAKIDNNGGNKGESKRGDCDKGKRGGGGDDNKKKNGGLLSRFLGFRKKSNKVELEEATYDSKNGGGNKKGKEGKLEGSKNDFDFYDTQPHPKNGKSSPMGQSPNIGNYPIGHQRENLPGDGGYHQGMQMQHAPYNNIQQQHHMGVMMNQHQHQQSNMYPTSMMYGRRHPSMNYMPPPPMADPITHTFSDENVESCSIM